MTLKLHNTLHKRTESFVPVAADAVRIYSCGPTVYDHAHIGNLSAFIAADVLRRVIQANGHKALHVMNFTDVDDKTIARSKQEHPDLQPLEALKQTTERYTNIFLEDMQAIGNDTSALNFIRATDEATIEGMRQLITQLYNTGFAYVADDGVYFSIEAYRKSGKVYGQLVELTEENTSNERIANDEYDKDSAHDFALWKKQKPGEPAWPFTLGDSDMTGRPGWHIECSVMSRQGLGQPFDIHTGGIDLAFPHHENEIAQSTAGEENAVYAQSFVHNEHILVDGRKMSKSLGNFFTLEDLREKNIDPLAFRMLVLQSHYRKPTNFSFDNIEAATNRLRNWRNVAALRHQTHDTLRDDDEKNDDETAVSLLASSRALIETLSNDLDTPSALKLIDEAFAKVEAADLASIHRFGLTDFLATIDDTLGLQLVVSTPDIDEDTKRLVLERQQAREQKDWQRADELRDALAQQGIVVKDTAHGPIWQYAG